MTNLRLRSMAIKLSILMKGQRLFRLFVVPLALILAPAVTARTVASLTEGQQEALSYGIDFWREAEGLSQSRIRAVTQTRDGYIWLGTDDGVVRFNGAGFKAFTVETGSLKDNEISALQEDREGGLWIGTYGGGLSLLKDGHFRTFTTSDGLPDDVIMRLDEDPEGNIWISTQSGACRYSDGDFTTF